MMKRYFIAGLTVDMDVSGRTYAQAVPYEVEREREFAPIKNATGEDSVETARELCRKNGILL